MPTISTYASDACFRSPAVTQERERGRLFALEFEALCEAARRVRAQALSEATRLAIADRDIARDVLLNCGGLGYSSATLQLATRQCERSLERLMRRRHAVDSGLLSMRHDLDLQSAVISDLDETTALSLHSGLHYLGMPRPGGRHFGLYLSQRGEVTRHLVVIASLHAFDLLHLVPRLIPKNDIGRTLVLSRLLSLPGAPLNSVSRLLGGVFRRLRNEAASIESLVTYNNPNLGFQGTIYKATNWHLIGFESKMPDLMLDGAYASLRRLRAEFGTFDYVQLKHQLKSRIAALPTPLQPLEIYACRIGGSHRRRQ